MDQNTCEHKYVHLETIKKQEYGSFHTKYIMLDRFFCERCLEEKVVEKHEYSRERPVWY